MGSRAAEWRRVLRKDVRLRSGVVVTVKKASLGDFILAGRIPQPVIDYVDALGTGKDKDLNVGERDLMRVIDGLVSELALDPKVVPLGDDGGMPALGENEIGVWEIPDTDKVELFVKALSEVGAADAPPFPLVPEGQGAGGDAGHGVAPVREEAVGDDVPGEGVAAGA